MYDPERPVNSRMRRAFLHAIFDTKNEVIKGPIARAYIGEKVDLCFAAQTQQDLVGRLDLERRAIYDRYMEGQ